MITEMRKAESKMLEWIILTLLMACYILTVRRYQAVRTPSHSGISHCLSHEVELDMETRARFFSVTTA